MYWCTVPTDGTAPPRPVPLPTCGWIHTTGHSTASWSVSEVALCCPLSFHTDADRERVAVIWSPVFTKVGMRCVSVCVC